MTIAHDNGIKYKNCTMISNTRQKKKNHTLKGEQTMKSRLSNSYLRTHTPTHTHTSSRCSQFKIVTMRLVLNCMTPDNKAKAKARDSYIPHSIGKPDQPRFTIIEVAVDRQEPMALQ